MKSVTWMERTYWLVWLIAVMAWFYSDLIGSIDSRAIVFFVGINCLGVILLIAFPAVLRACIKQNEIGDIYKTIMFSIARIFLWLFCCLAFIISADWYEMTLQSMMQNTQVNDLPLVEGVIVMPWVFVSMGSFIGFYMVNSKWSYLSLVRYTVSVVVLLTFVIWLLLYNT